MTPVYYNRMSLKSNALTRAFQHLDIMWKVVVVVSALAICVALGNYIPHVGTFVRFPFAILQCGKVPVMAEENDGVKLYYMPGSSLYQLTAIPDGRFYCSETDAKQAGYLVNAR